MYKLVLGWVTIWLDVLIPIKSLTLKETNSDCVNSGLEDLQMITSLAFLVFSLVSSTMPSIPSDM